MLNSTTSIMGLLDDYSGTIGSPRPSWQHQLVIMRILHNMYDEVEGQGFIIMTEATVTDDWDDLAPDLIVFDEHYNPQMIIEITTHKELRAIMRKCKELIVRFLVAEYFVYDYERNILHRFAPELNKWLSSDEYELFSVFLSEPVINYIVKDENCDIQY